ncbi:hypothetical protein ONA22_07305 [Mycoplasmopsis cynos]|uniref:hypothetical protein n=1 Tax=Mycoplasmopsis cynos TaxID=171284 RepID=UPI0024CDB1FE|nr:hypothetical protein [Mycoplasmopsis cynos]WAM03458.1 hypothetical protein ONA22_07305 [Mycoplasmopsis cynos]
MAYRLNIPIYQADPYASFQRGLNENFNGLVRREFPKGTNFNKISEKEIYTSKDHKQYAKKNS